MSVTFSSSLGTVQCVDATALMVYTSLTALGFLDDYLKVSSETAKGFHQGKSFGKANSGDHLAILLNHPLSWIKSKSFGCHS